MIKKPRRQTITRNLRSRRIKIIPTSSSFKPKINKRRRRKINQRERSPVESEASSDSAHDETQHDDLVHKVKNYESTIAALKGMVDKAKQEKLAISQRKIKMEEAISNRTRGKTLLTSSADLHVDDRRESRPEDRPLTDNEDEGIYEIEEADFREYDNDSSVDIRNEEGGNTGLFTPPHSTSHHPSRARHRYQPYTLSNRLGMIEQNLQRVSWKTHESTDRISRLENKYQKLATKLNSQETESLKEERQERRERNKDNKAREENGVKALVVLAAFGFGAGIATMNIGRALATGFSI
ncbi:351_t:CDS:2 [Paraglomus brasilianum]|uniref:351_t:CDS:1 n=1 Tax=Paraglomus brasilianum TaxID=144538 RepID=A0A9N9BL94_9GLOM|nr:351_t:CDS:2 [Paraglomus brasilianum]